MTCRCGAEFNNMELIELCAWHGRYDPTWRPASCRCHRCVSCHHHLDNQDRCPNLNCPLVGTHIIIPDQP